MSDLRHEARIEAVEDEFRFTPNCRQIVRHEKTSEEANGRHSALHKNC
jgi:hypothetical protein